MNDATVDHTDAASEFAAQIGRAIDVLRAGGVVAIPTDTVYGIAASLEQPSAIDRLFVVKGRSGTKAIPVLVSARDSLRMLSPRVNTSAERLADAFWPGPLTIVVEAKRDIPDAALRGGTTVGLRMPDHPVALAIIAGAGGALAVTSANRSGDSEARSAGEVQARLGGRVDFIVDAGPSPGGKASTVVDVTVDPPRVLRAGSIEAWRLFGSLAGEE